jgi:hypothetical protein
MIDTDRTGPDAGRYLFMPFETGTGGVQRVDLWDTNIDMRTVTIVESGTQGFVAGGTSRWTPRGTYLTAEERWSEPDQVAGSKGRLFEITNATTAGTNGAIFEHRKIGPACIRASHGGLAFDSNNSFCFIDERNDSHLFKITSANPNAANGVDFFGAGQTSVPRVGDRMTQEVTGACTWVSLTNATGAALANTTIASHSSAPVAGVQLHTPSEAADAAISSRCFSRSSAWSLRHARQAFASLQAKASRLPGKLRSSTRPLGSITSNPKSGRSTRRGGRHPVPRSPALSGHVRGRGPARAQQRKARAALQRARQQADRLQQLAAARIHRSATGVEQTQRFRPHASRHRFQLPAVADGQRNTKQDFGLECELHVFARFSPRSAP